VLYSKKDGSREVGHFANIHEIRNSKVCEGSALERSELMNLCHVLMPRLGKGLVLQPDRVIAYSDAADGGSGLVVWWRPALITRLLFSEGTKIPSGPAPVPALLFMASGSALSVWALKENERPVQNTKLWNAPFPNVGNRGGICMGNARLPQVASPDLVEEYEKMFFRSKFSTHHMPQFANDAKPAMVWTSLIKKGVKEFPMDILVSSELTLAGLLQGGAHD
jgi:PRTRC genetic system protein B